MTLEKKFTDTVDDGLTNAAWDAYDALIKAEVSGYNTRFAGTPGYKDVDWKIPKAMVWIESGGLKNSAWKTRPMQIGNTGDPGHGVLKASKEGADTIMSDQLKKDITGNIDEPKLNIRAGIAYLFVRMAQTDIESVDDERDRKIYEHTVVKDDSLDKIARSVGSTVEVLEKLNPSATILKLKQIILYRKASKQRVIKGWRAFDTKTVAERYNGNGVRGKGDSNYSAKLDYVLELFKKLKR